MTELSSFDPTPKLKSSPIPINFVSFYDEDDYCYYCSNQYTYCLFSQKYCKNCLLQYVHDINDIDNNCICLDANTYNLNTGCVGNIVTDRNTMQNLINEEWQISYFSQIPTGSKMINFPVHNKFYPDARNCNLCGKLTSYQRKFWENPVFTKFSVCSDCYLISSERIESLNNKYPISVVYLPWWYVFDKCFICNLALNFMSNCQKWCESCQIIFVGCRYCLTTNIIFGLSDHSQCRKCKRISSISINSNSISGNHDIDEFLHSTKFNRDSIHNVNRMKCSCPMDVYEFIKANYTNVHPESIMEWIPYCQITNLEKIAEGGFSIVYKAIWLDGELHRRVVGKRLKYSQKISKAFLNELRSHHKCYKRYHVIRCYGVTKDPSTGEYMFVMPFAKKGTLHHNLQKKFLNMDWKRKIEILTEISHGLETIHGANFTHRDFHSKNVLFGIDFSQQYQIGDLGLSQPADSPLNNHEIYGIVPYIAPEIFKSNVVSPKSSDVYSLGMIMWECTTGLQPFADVEHNGKLICDITNGRRPEITKDTPECFANLMRRCWDNDPTKRPSVAEICNNFFFWNFFKENEEQFNLAEKKRLELIQLKMLGPEFAEKPHPKAIYTSRPLRSLISECSSMIASTNLTSNLLISSNMKMEYISIECELDISSRPLSDVKASRKRNIEELNIESDIKTQDDEKRTKIDENLISDDEIEI